MHRGVDFAAPKGTPIMAAGDGVIEAIGRKGVITASTSVFDITPPIKPHTGTSPDIKGG